MNKSDIYENYYFKNMINIISKEHYPSTFPMHWHKYVEIITLLDQTKSESKATLKVNQENFILQAGDILFIWPGELHEIVDNRRKQLIAIQFPITMISDIRDFTTYINLYKNFHQLTVIEYPKLTEDIASLLTEMISMQRSGEDFHGVEMLIRLYRIFMVFGTYVNEHSSKNKTKQKQYDQTYEKMQAVCSYIQENCDQDITLDQISKLSGFSTYYFSRIFKEVTTFNFIEYLSLQRVKRVQSLLIDSNLSITEAAYQAGFRSLSSFNRVFKHYNGCSPSEYKKYNAD